MAGKRPLEVVSPEEIYKRQRVGQVKKKEEEEECHCCGQVHWPQMAHTSCTWRRTLFTFKKVEEAKRKDPRRRRAVLLDPQRVTKEQNFLAWVELLEKEGGVEVDLGKGAVKRPQRECRESRCLCCGGKHAVGVHDMSGEEWQDRESYVREGARDSESSSSSSSSSSSEDASCRPSSPPLVITEYYYVGKHNVKQKTQGDVKQCSEYEERTENLQKCIDILMDGQELGRLHSSFVGRSLSAGHHNPFEVADRRESKYVIMAKEAYLAKVRKLVEENEEGLVKYLLAALKAVQEEGQLLHRIRLMEVVLYLLQGQVTYPLDLEMLAAFCHNISQTSSLRRYASRPLKDILMALSHNLLSWLRREDMAKMQDLIKSDIFQLVGEPTLNQLGYLQHSEQPNVASLYNNVAKIHPDNRNRLNASNDSLLRLVVPLYQSLELSSKLGPLSDSVYTLLAIAAAKAVAAPPLFMSRLVEHLHSPEGAIPGPEGCVALVRLMELWHHQLEGATGGLALLQKLASRLLKDDSAPASTGAARALGYLLRCLDANGHSWAATVSRQAKEVLRGLQSGEHSESEDCKRSFRFVVHCGQIVCRAARALRREAQRDEATGEMLSEVKCPPMEMVLEAMSSLEAAKGPAAWRKLARALSLPSYHQVTSSKVFCSLIAQLEPTNH